MPRVPPAAGGHGPVGPAAGSLVQRQARPGPRVPAAALKQAPLRPTAPPPLAPAFKPIQRKAGTVTSDKTQAGRSRIGQGRIRWNDRLQRAVSGLHGRDRVAVGRRRRRRAPDDETFENETTADQLAAFKGVIGSTTVTMDSRPVAGSDTVTPSVAEYASSDTSARSWAEVAFKCKNVTSKWSQKAGPYTF
jgi:hypothetical protein